MQAEPRTLAVRTGPTEIGGGRFGPKPADDDETRVKLPDIGRAAVALRRYETALARVLALDPVMISAFEAFAAAGEELEADIGLATRLRMSKPLEMAYGTWKNDLYANRPEDDAGWHPINGA